MLHLNSQLLYLSLEILYLPALAFSLVVKRKGIRGPYALAFMRHPVARLVPAESFLQKAGHIVASNVHHIALAEQ